MSVNGRVVNGVVVLPPGMRLPEGTEVKVETVQSLNAGDPFTAAVNQILAQYNQANERKTPGALPDDMAANLDYYLHGHARKHQPRSGRWLGANSAAELTEQQTVADAEALSSMAAETTGLPADLSANHDHYLHGLPKQ